MTYRFLIAALRAIALLCLVAPTAYCANYECLSPSGTVRVEVKVDQGVTWSAWYRDKPVLQDCRLSLELSDRTLPPAGAKVLGSDTATIDEELSPTVPTRSAKFAHKATELTLSFDGGIDLQVRAYDLGVAYRFATQLTGYMEVRNELAEFRFVNAAQVQFPEETSFMSHYEREYKALDLSAIADSQFCSLPVLLHTSDNVFAAITDADLYDYPAMFLAGTNGLALTARFPSAVLATTPEPKQPDRNELLTEEASYIAKTDGKRTLPWRVVMLADHPGRWLEDDLVFKLSRPLALEDTSWIKPGKVAWDWWNALNLTGVDFPAGINTATYKHFIDFAAEYGLEYIVLDEGWSKSTTELREPCADLDLEAVIAYGKSKQVGVILWTLWKPLDQDMDQVLDQWAAWGVKGVKVDFMQRADQQMVQFYERVAREAAKRQMLVDYHGAFKPAGLQRAYPNVVNYEGVKGLENCKWSDLITPEHDVTLPFTRMLAGPLDFTPGAMDNAGPKGSFLARFDRPMSQGTRCHQVAMYVVYEAPLQMLADSPSAYQRDPDCTRFIAQIPTTWDETRVLAGEVGKYIVIARRHGSRWFVAAMTNSERRDLTVDLSFLGAGTWKLDYIKDGVNAERNATDYHLGNASVSQRDVLGLTLSSGGGWAGVLSPAENGRTKRTVAK